MCVTKIQRNGVNMVKSPFNWVILPLTQPQVANQQQKNILLKNTVAHIGEIAVGEDNVTKNQTGKSLN